MPSASSLLAFRVRAIPGTRHPLPSPAISRDTERLCENNLAGECLVSQDPSSFHLTFFYIQLLPFVGVTEWGPVGRTGFLPAAWGTVGPVCSPPKGVMWAALTPILRKVNYLSIISPSNPDRTLHGKRPALQFGDGWQCTGKYEADIPSPPLPVSPRLAGSRLPG